MTDRPKLLVVIGTLAHMGGAERQALYLVEHLSRLQWCDVELLAFEDGTALRPTLAALGVRVHVHPYYFRWPKKHRAVALFNLARRLRFGIKPQALLPFVGIHSKTAAMVLPYSGARFCWWNQQDEGRDLTGTALERRILTQLSCINSNSEAGRDFLVTTYGLAPETVLVYNNGTPTPSLNRKSTWRQDHGLDGQPIVSMVANITSFKDHATLLRAWARMTRRPISIRPVLLLAGHLREQATVASLKLLAFELGLSSDDVIFLGPVEDVESLIRDSDVLVHSSKTEGCPNAVCEAMALAKPVVATNIPGCRQALGTDEWLAAPDDADALASLLLKLLDDAELRQSVGQENRKRIESNFTIEAMNRFFTRQIEAGLGISSQ
jgi:glycosyltransferase involved in cell wall biosynthesis